MAYKITYGQGNGKANLYRHTKQKDNEKKIRTIIATIFCIICCWLLVFELHRSFFISENSEAIQQAFSTFTNELQQGRPVGDAISTFCEEILIGAGT